MGCAKPHAVIAAEYRAVGRNRMPRSQFTVLRRKPSRYRESQLGNCIQPQQVLRAWTRMSRVMGWPLLLTTTCVFSPFRLGFCEELFVNFEGRCWREARCGGTEQC